MWLISTPNSRAPEREFFSYIIVDKSQKIFVASLQTSTAAKVSRTIDLLERFGNQLGMPHSKKVGERLYELRVRGEQEVRIFYTFNNGVAILLHGYIKKSQKMSQKEWSIAKEKLQTLD